MAQSGREDFFEAAVRHWVDGAVLEENKEYDNAVCMQGFAAECALKAILEKGIAQQETVDEIVKKYSHRTDILLSDMEMMLLSDIVLTAILDPASGIRLSGIAIPDVLIKDHPERRYFGDGTYSEEDARVCRKQAELYVKEMLRLYVDGYI